MSVEVSFEGTAIVACGTMRRELTQLKEEGFLNPDVLLLTAPGLHEWQTVRKRAPCLAIFLTVMSSILISCAASPNAARANVFFDKGLARYAKEDNDGAIECFNTALKLNPRNIEALIARGRAKGKKGNLEGALVDFNKALCLKPGCIEAFINRAKALFFQGNFDSAISDCNKVLDFEPNRVDAFRLRGDCQYKKGILNKAIEDYDMAIRLDPEHADIYSNRGRARAEKGDYEGSIADFNKAIALFKTRGAEEKLAFTYYKPRFGSASAAV